MAVIPAPFQGRVFRVFALGLMAQLLALALSTAQLVAAPFAALVMDARTGEVLYSDNADTRLHPASLTKMMTLYIAFTAIEHGEISLDTLVTISSNAASEPPSKLGLRAGQKIPLRYLIRAAAIKSANDAATAIGEAVGGSEAAFARRMNRTAQALGMTRTTFKNANGLTQSGHMSTAHDMAILGRHLLYDHPEYYNLFSRRSSDAGGKTVYNTNRKFLAAYEGADGIKTGYTVAAGFNLVASAKRGNERIIGVVMGGTSTAMRNAKMASLLDLGFRKAPSKVKPNMPTAPDYNPPVYADVESSPVPPARAMASLDVDADEGEDETGAGAVAKTLRVSGATARSLIPRARPDRDAAVQVASAEDTTEEAEEAALPDAEVVASLQDNISGALAALQAEAGEAEDSTAEPAVNLAAAEDAATEEPQEEPQQLALAVLPATGHSAPPARPARLTVTAPEAQPAETLAVAEAVPAVVPPARPEMAQAEVQLAAAKTDEADSGSVQLAAVDALAVGDAPADIDISEEDEGGPADAGTVELASADPLGAVTSDEPAVPAALAAPIKITPEIFPASAGKPVVVTRLSTSGGRNWGINIGTFNSQYEAEKMLLKTALMESGTLDDALRKVGRGRRGFEANFLGMTEDMASLACQRLSARALTCKTLGPDSPNS